MLPYNYHGPSHDQAIKSIDEDVFSGAGPINRSRRQTDTSSSSNEPVFLEIRLQRDKITGELHVSESAQRTLGNLTHIVAGASRNSKKTRAINDEGSVKIKKGKR